jgi:hypothetical protein
MALFAMLLGLVLDPQRRAVPAAVVTLSRDFMPVATAVTTTDGTFRMEVESGWYEISIRSNAATLDGYIFISDAPPVARTFIAVDPDCLIIEGRVMSSGSAQPVRGAEVHYLGDGTSDEHGDYFIDLGCSAMTIRFHNTFVIEVEAAGFFPFSFHDRGEGYHSPVIRDFVLVPRRRRAAGNWSSSFATRN